MKNSLQLVQSVRVLQQVSEAPIDKQNKQIQNKVSIAINEQAINQPKLQISLQNQRQYLCIFLVRYFTIYAEECMKPNLFYFFIRIHSICMISKDQIYKFITFPHFIPSMLEDPHKKKRTFFKVTSMQQQPTSKTVLPMAVKQITPNEKISQTIHARKLLQHKLHPNTKFKMLLQTLAKYEPAAKQQRRHLTEDGRKMSINEESTCKMNQLIFRRELQAYTKKLEQRRHSRYLSDQSQKESRFNPVNLRRSFRIAQHCKSSLLHMSLKARANRYEPESCISHSNIEMRPARPKREYSLRVSLKRKEEKGRSLTRADQIRGWDVSPKDQLPSPSPSLINIQVVWPTTPSRANK